VFDLIGFLIAGGIVGAIARLLVPGEDPMPWWGTVLLGAGAAIIGGWIARVITPDNRGFPWIGALIAGVGLVLIVRFVRGRQTS
jgi:uncharacterized membrane protein YeaQ/YmgE (transglycosylase-associated protein family)